MNNKIIELEEVWKTYLMGSVKINALQGLTMEIKEGEFVALVGPSGSGKSTALHIIGCLDISTHGSVKFENQNVTRLNDRKLTNIRSAKIGFIFQTFNLIPSLTTLENVEIGLRFANSNLSRATRFKKAMESLVLVGLEDRINHLPNELSGGERQRVAIARAIVKSPKLLLADEPTGNLDSKTGMRIVKILEELHSNGLTILVVTHNHDVAAKAKRKMELQDGKIIEG
ncbi:MAG: ABC transporter ATP-binding protein [bacterium]